MQASPNKNKNPCNLHLVTSGYSFPEWIQAGIYPPGTANKDMLGFYSQKFGATELNYTWYQMPKAGAMERMLSLVPAGFMFTAKLTHTMTHEIDPQNWWSQVKSYRLGVAPLVQAQRLIAVLVQLGPAFQRTRDNRLYLAHLLDELQGLRAAVEFRHRSWADDKVFAELEKRRVALLAWTCRICLIHSPPARLSRTPTCFMSGFMGAM
jgi:uncharacterized protein YecE (DUF72 family)